MNISVLGTGRMGQGLVNVLAPHYSGLVWASRTPEKAEGICRKRGWTGVMTSSYREALNADIIFHSFWFRDLIPWAQKNEKRLAGRILVDIANPFTEDFSDFTLDWGQSAAEELQKMLPHTAVVGAFKNTFFQVLEQPLHQGEKSDIFVTGDDGEARRTVLNLLKPLPFRAWDSGNLENNRTIERMTLFERELAIRYGNYPYVSYRLFGMDEYVI